jgi:hypothetical protein
MIHKKGVVMVAWELFVNEGKQLHKSASGKNGQPSKLNNSIRYNLYALSLEKSLMGLLMFHGDMADNHTFQDLLYSAERHCAVPRSLREELYALENVQSICSLTNYTREDPSDEVVARLQIATWEIMEFVKYNIESKEEVFK